MTTTAQTLERAVLAVCGHMSEQHPFVVETRLTERQLWQELISCVLSSQVVYETAVAAASQAMRSGLFQLVKTGTTTYRVLERVLRQTLTAPIAVRPDRCVRFRFPNAKASQIARTALALQRSEISLRTITYEPDAGYDKRRKLIGTVYGFGPKQASMYIRNTGAATDLAILDRHTLRYLALQKVTSPVSKPLSLSRYELIEAQFQHYAINLGIPSDRLDYAIWIVMRVASAERLL